MPKKRRNGLSKRSPEYIPIATKHRATGQAVLRLNGHDYYLGKYGSKAAKQEYDKLIQEWLARGRQTPANDEGLSINELLVAYLRFARGYYKQGTSNEISSMKPALRILKSAYGHTTVSEFGPLAIKAVRQVMIDKDWCRSYINHQINRIRRIFRWGVSEEMVPADVIHGLNAVTGLRKGMSSVRESPPVKPVPDAHVNAVLPLVSPAVATMIRLQLLTGCRPHEVCMMRSCDLETTGRVWVYRPQTHKTEHFGHTREIYIGPKAQAILKPWLNTDLQAYLFSPADAEEKRMADRKVKRQTPMTPSQRKRKRKPNRRRAWGDVYKPDAYRYAIYRACKKANVPTWAPNRLRHNAATNLRKEHGVELARIILGHATAFTTEIYAEADRMQAMEVMGKIG